MDSEPLHWRFESQQRIFQKLNDPTTAKIYKFLVLRRGSVSSFKHGQTKGLPKGPEKKQ